MSEFPNDWQTIRLEENGPVARLVLARPPLNVLNILMLEEMNAAIDRLAGSDRLRVLVFEAEGKAFSAGVDVADHVDDRVRPMIAAFHGLFRRLAAFAPITVAAVRGAALGGGCEVATFCDLVVASRSAKFGQPEIHLGVFPPLSAVAFPYFVRGKKTLELMLTGDRIDADTAERYGLVNRVFADEDFDDGVAAFIESLASKSGVALRLAKKAYYAAIDVPFAEGLDRAERIYLAELMESHDAVEGIQAFMDKRPAVWEDR